jgi:hypothetical protein
MKSYLKLVFVALAASFVTVSGFSAETATTASSTAATSPAGTWKWSQPGRDGATFEQTLKLAYQDGKLTGTLLGGQRGDFQIPDVEISDASFKDGAISFSVAREFNGNKFVSKYEGVVQGDSIKGSSERPGRDGGAPRKSDWNATRS